MNTIAHIGIVMSLISILTIVAPAATTIISFGGPGYVTQGISFTYSPGLNGGGANGSSANSGTDWNFWFYNNLGQQCWIDFSAPKNKLLTVGKYENIVQYTKSTPVLNKPSFNLTNVYNGNYRTLFPIPSGYFNVLENVEGQYSTPLRFAADFVTYDSTGQPTAGSIRWSSDIPLTPISQLLIPEASTSFLFTFVLGLSLCRRRRD